MLSFVWTDPLPLYSGRGGTESFTIGHLRELKRRGIQARILTYGLGTEDGRQYFPDIEFKNLNNLKELEHLDDTLIYLNIPHNIPTKRQSFVMFHFPAIEQHGSRAEYKKWVGDSKVITNSRFLRSFWADYLDVKETKIAVVYPFADPAFSKVKRTPSPKGVTRVLYAGRLSPEKGIYMFLESLHHPVAAHKPLTTIGYQFTVTSAGSETIHGKVIKDVLKHHPWINIVEAKHGPEAMAELFAQNDIVVMPSATKYWNESFGMVSVEAQHSGCRVVVSNSGGLPETNCGELMLFEPGNSYTLYKAMIKAAKLGPMVYAGRKEARKHFTLAASVKSLLNIVKANK